MNEDFIRASSVELLPPEHEGRCRTFFTSFDIFAFLPVPKGDSISTNRSICGSLTVFILFLSYIGYSMWEFFGHNIPATNQYFIPLSNDITAESPPFAFAFMSGENLNETVHNKSYFDFQVEQVTIYKDPNIPREYKRISHGHCNVTQLPWLNFSLTSSFLCAKSKLNLQGLIYSSPIHQYPRITFTLCNPANTTVPCAPRNETIEILKRGRIFFFLRKASDTDYATGKVFDGGFYSKNYFVVDGLYNRAELQIQIQDTFQYPDWLTRLSTSNSRDLSLSNEQFYVSKTPNENLLFMVWLRLDANISKSEIKYLTIVDYISKWGALWSVFLTVGALYFLRYNKKNFYNENPEWDEFEKEIAVIRSLKRRIRNPSRLLSHSIEQDNLQPPLLRN